MTITIDKGDMRGDLICCRRLTCIRCIIYHSTEHCSHAPQRRDIPPTIERNEHLVLGRFLVMHGQRGVDEVRRHVAQRVVLHQIAGPLHTVHRQLARSEVTGFREVIDCLGTSTIHRSFVYGAVSQPRTFRMIHGDREITGKG